MSADDRAMKITGYGRGWQEPRATTRWGCLKQKLREPATTTTWYVAAFFFIVFVVFV